MLVATDSIAVNTLPAGLRWILIRTGFQPVHTASWLELLIVSTNSSWVRPLDGDVPFDATGVAHIYKNENIYVRLKDDSLCVDGQVCCRSFHLYFL